MAQRVNSEGLGIYRNLQYALHPRLVNSPSMHGKVKVITEGESWRVIYTDPILVRSPFIGLWFSKEFTQQEVLASRDLEVWLSNVSGYRFKTEWRR